MPAKNGAAPPAEGWLAYARDAFAGDLYATQLTGIAIQEAEPGRAVCTLAVTPQHCNAIGRPMGGAIFTLADLAFAVCANLGRETTVSLSSNITYLTTAQDSKLTAEARLVRSGRRTCFGIVEVYDGAENHIATVTASGCTV